MYVLSEPYVAFTFCVLTASSQRIQVLAARDEYVVHCSSLLAVTLTRLRTSEIVLSLLLAKFTFAPPPGKTIIWNLSNVRFPSVGDSPKPSIAMIVGLYGKTKNSE